LPMLWPLEESQDTLFPVLSDFAIAGFSQGP
jgi:hypothetical protein